MGRRTRGLALLGAAYKTVPIEQVERMLAQRNPEQWDEMQRRGYTAKSMVDLASRLGFESTEASDRNVIIVADIGGQVVGLLVDAVSDILTITDDMIQPTPDVASETAKTFVRGLIPMEGRMISLIGLERVLPEALELEAA